jgi:hypothetical protein
VVIGEELLQGNCFVWVETVLHVMMSIEHIEELKATILHSAGP